MAVLDMQTPEVIVEIAGVDYEPIGVTVYSSRTSPIDRAEILLNPDEIDWSKLQDADCSVYMGFEGTVYKTFGGRVFLPVPENPLRVTALDTVQRLKTAIVTTAIVRPTLRDVLDTTFSQVGMTDWEVADHDVTNRLFLARSISGTDVIQACRQSFGVADWDFYATPEGHIYFGPWEDSARAKVDPVLTLEQGVNIIEYTPDLRGGRVLTYLAPWVLHGHRITIKDSEILRGTITARVERVIHTVNAEVGGTTELRWTPVNS